MKKVRLLWFVALGMTFSCLVAVPLIDAVVGRDLPKVQKLLAEGADPNVTDSEGETVLYIAVAHAGMDEVYALLEAGADPKVIGRSGRSPVFAAFNSASIDNEQGYAELGFMISFGKVNLKVSDNGDETLMDKAIRRGDKKILKIILFWGGDPSALQRNPNLVFVSKLWESAKNLQDKAAIVTARKVIRNNALQIDDTDAIKAAITGLGLTPITEKLVIKWVNRSGMLEIGEMIK